MNHAYLILHGINTPPAVSAKYLSDFKSLMAEKGDSGEVYDGSYGKVSTWMLALPWIGKLIHRPIIHMMKVKLERLSQDHRRLIIIAHSNGTHIVTRAMEQSRRNFNNVYLGLFGSTVRCRYNFHNLYGEVKAVWNFCSTKDKVIHFLPKLIGRGSSGYWGFRRHSGAKAIVDEELEVAWNPQKQWDYYPQVINCHYNYASHGDWIDSPKFIRVFLTEVHKHILEKESVNLK